MKRLVQVLIVLVVGFMFGFGLGKFIQSFEHTCTHAHAEIADGRAVAKCDAWAER